MNIFVMEVILIYFIWDLECEIVFIDFLDDFIVQ